MSVVELKVNGVSRRVDVADGTPLLYVLRNDLELSGPQFGCGLAQCGACSVLRRRQGSALVRHAAETVAGKEITTLEGLPARWAKQQGLPPRRPPSRRCIRCSRRGSTSRCRSAASARTA